EMLERRKRMQEQFVKTKEESKKLLPPPAPKYAPEPTPEMLERRKRMQEQFVIRKEESKKELEKLGKKEWKKFTMEFGVARDDVNTFENKIKPLFEKYPRLRATVVFEGEFELIGDDLPEELKDDYKAGKTFVRKWINWKSRYELSS